MVICSKSVNASMELSHKPVAHFLPDTFISLPKGPIIDICNKICGILAILENPSCRPDLKCFVLSKPTAHQNRLITIYSKNINTSKYPTSTD